MANFTISTTSTGDTDWTNASMAGINERYLRTDVKWKSRELTLDEILFDSPAVYKQKKREIVLDIDVTKPPWHPDKLDKQVWNPAKFINPPWDVWTDETTDDKTWGDNDWTNTTWSTGTWTTTG